MGVCFVAAVVVLVLVVVVDCDDKLNEFNLFLVATI